MVFSLSPVHEWKNLQHAQVFLALVLVWNVGTITTDEALSGFNNPGVLAVGSLFVVIKGVEKSRLAGMYRRSVLYKTGCFLWLNV